jgi:hypothetical protein
MAVLLSPIGGVAGQFFDNNGNPLVGGKLFTYAAGTTTPQATFTSALGITPHSNPIILNGGGRVPGEIWLTDGLQYKFVLFSSTDQLIGSWDNIVGINSNFVNFVTSEEIQIATAGQTVFTLTTMQYQPGTNSLVVYVDGVNQVQGGSFSYVETNSTTVTFTTGLHVGAVVKFVSAQTLTGSATSADLVSYLPAGFGAVAQSVAEALDQRVIYEETSKTFLVPGDFNNISEALSHIDKYVFALGETCTILLQSGYVISEQVILLDKKYGHVVISSEDQEVTVSRQAITESFSSDGDIGYEPVFAGARSVLPTINTLFVFDSSGSISRQSGIMVVEGSHVTVNSGCGFKEFVHQGLVARSGSTAYAAGSVFTCQTLQGQHTVNNGGISSWTGASVMADGSDVSFCYYGARSAVGGYLNFIRGVANDCQRHGIRANEGGRVNARLAEAKRAGSTGLNVSRNGHAEAQEMDVTGCEIGVNSSGASACDASGTFANDCDIGFQCNTSSTLNAGGSTGSAGRFASAQNCRIGVFAQRASAVTANGINVNNCSLHGIYAYRSSTIDAEQSSANNAGGRGYFAERNSRINCSFSSATGCGLSGAEAYFGSSIEGSESNFSGSSSRGVRSWQGSSMSIRNSNCQKGASPSSGDVQCRIGSTISAAGVTGGLEITPNTITAAGIIFQ